MFMKFILNKHYKHIIRGKYKMNLSKELSKNKLKLLEEADVHIEDREYSKEELRNYEMKVEEFVMSHSTKNGDVSKFTSQYSNILNDLIKYQQK